MPRVCLEVDTLVPTGVLVADAPRAIAVRRERTLVSAAAAVVVIETCVNNADTFAASACPSGTALATAFTAVARVGAFELDAIAVAKSELVGAYTLASPGVLRPLGLIESARFFESVDPETTTYC